MPDMISENLVHINVTPLKAFANRVDMALEILRLQKKGKKFIWTEGEFPVYLFETKKYWGFCREVQELDISCKILKEN